MYILLHLLQFAVFLFALSPIYSLWSWFTSFVSSTLCHSLAAQTAFFFDIGTGKKGLVKWSVQTGDHVIGIHVNK